ncbi:protein UPSTREAM OF FLC-like [Senna tora]|uniref:Protein UPSTREAM OF FLC-like n=1 Tax=Senna tora TaxID=362788 RepID=A0A834X878_9FABA|nr:protein UPSTREAM OF FLC-like [Senna tora]
MEIVGSRRSGRDTSPDLAKICRPQPQHHHHKLNNNNKNNKKAQNQRVQVIYYLSRSGLLEHPHYMELMLSPNQPLRLKDVLDRLVALRGTGMPSLYSWSCKRNYKRGYVWCDLAANDVVYPTEGAEYVLKGSQLVQEASSERVEEVQVIKPQTQPNHHQSEDPNPNSKRRSSFQYSIPPEVEFQDYTQEEEEEEEEDYEEGEEKTSSTTSTTPHSRCSRGVSTDGLDEDHEPGPRAQPKPAQMRRLLGLEDGLAPSRNSILLQLIACGSAKGKTTASGVSKVEEKNGGVKVVWSSEEDEMIKCMSENPRFGNIEMEEKEYFSGSIVESRKDSEVVLKKSNSYNQERCEARHHDDQEVGNMGGEEKKKKKMTNFYKVLCLEWDKKVGIGEIRKAYRKMALQCHPDLCADQEDSTRRFIEVRKAYDTLCDPFLRELHDHELSLGMEVNESKKCPKHVWEAQLGGLKERCRIRMERKVKQ